MISIAHISAIGPTTAAMTYGTSSSPGGADMSVLDCPIATLPKGRLPLQAPANRGIALVAVVALPAQRA
jgi:hypothetical protein